MTTIDLGQHDLPADPVCAAQTVVALIEQSDIDLDGDEPDFLVGGRRFSLVWGAGREIIETTGWTLGEVAQ